ncbi:MAG: HAD-IIB family hydrolase [Bryobacterales bacterium]|nr:HAD-IIB family hydrolase [Bryobacterales bacterium]
MKVIFTDLDGTLLDHNSYSTAAAEEALHLIRQQGIPLVFSTSKTRAEVELWRRKLGIEGPFIVENGGAIYIPRGYFDFPLPKGRQSGGYRVIEYGDPYPELVATLEDAARWSGCRVLGFHSMSVAELCLRTRLPVAQAELAKQREYDEPFEVLDSGTYRLLEAIEARGKRWTRGGRFYHITGKNDKATAVRQLSDLFRKAHGSVATIGIGDGWNDVPFLQAVDVPIVIRSGISDALRRAVPNSALTPLPGVSGWNRAVLGAVSGMAAAAG